MPIDLDSGLYRFDDALHTVNYHYDYKDGRDWRPGSELHERILKAILVRAKSSRDKMLPRHERWKEVDKLLNVYIPEHDKETRKQKWNQEKDVQVIIPMLYANREIYLSLIAATFLESPIFRYEGIGPEDELGALMLEKVIDIQTIRGQIGLDLINQWGDGLGYGFGAVRPTWETRWKHRRSPNGDFIEPTMLWEGNRLENIDPFLTFPDTNMPARKIAKGEFFGWLDPAVSYFSLLSEEAHSEGDMFNVQYLKHVKRRSTFYDDPRTEMSKAYSRDEGTEDITMMTDLLPWYMWIIPREWKLGKEDFPVLWCFTVGADRVITEAYPTEFDEIPIDICAPDYDGYMTSPISRLEHLAGMQHAMDWFINSRIANVLKVQHGQFVVDPYLLNMLDMQEGGPGLLAKLRQAGWGRPGALDAAIKQLPVTDVTAGHMTDVFQLLDLFQRVGGITDPLQGVVRSGGERRSATEIQSVMGSAFSRLEFMIQLIDMMSMQKIGMHFAHNQNEYQSQELYVKTAGRWESNFLDEYGMSEGWVKISPGELDINYDIVPRAVNKATGDTLQNWMTIYEMVTRNPAIGARYNIVNMFKHITRIMGVRNADKFLRQGGEVRARMMEDEQILNMLDKGNLQSVGGNYGRTPMAAA